MSAVISIVFDDIKACIRGLALVAASISFLTVICAAAVYLNYSVMGSSELARGYFESIMSFKGVAISPLAHNLVTILNWVVFAAVAFWCVLNGMSAYRGSIIERAKGSEIRTAAAAKRRQYANWIKEREQDSIRQEMQIPRAGNE